MRAEKIIIFLNTGLGRVTLSHGLTALYMVIADSLFFESMYGIMRKNQASLLIAILLFALIAIETVCLWYKLPIAVTASRKGEGANPVFILWIFHMLTSIMMYFAAIQALGYKLAGHKPSWVYIGLILVIVRGIVLLFRASTEKEIFRPWRHEWLLDLGLTLFACAACTIVWDVTLADIKPSRSATKDFIMLTILFCMLILPLSWVYLIEEFKNSDTARERVIAYITTSAYIMVGVLTAM